MKIRRTNLVKLLSKRQNPIPASFNWKRNNKIIYLQFNRMGKVKKNSNFHILIYVTVHLSIYSCTTRLIFFRKFNLSNSVLNFCLCLKEDRKRDKSTISSPTVFTWQSATTRQLNAATDWWMTSFFSRCSKAVAAWIVNLHSRSTVWWLKDSSRFP